MYKFTDSSKERLEQCHPDLVRLFLCVLSVHDCTVVEGHRGQLRQDELYRTGFSKVRFPLSKHNLNPSRAIDVAPCPIDWADHKRFYYFAGIVKGVSEMLGIKIRWGGDWDGDNDLNDQSFMDLAHFELRLDDES